ncbi:MAG: adenylate/guanylate cyclase domain-containing protein [Alphaproteobacteria bacterium]
MRWFGRRLHILVPLCILFAAVMIRASEPWLVEQARLIVFDTYLRLKPRAYDPNAPVRIIDIDEGSLERVGQWPWPRTIVAQLIERLGAMGAVAIGFDVVFAEPDRTSPSRIARYLPSTPDFEPLRAQLRDLPDSDDVLAAAIGSTPTITGFVLTNSGGNRPPALKAGFALAGDDPKPFLLDYAGAVPSLPVLEAAASGNGSVTGLPDRDGVIRRTPLILRMGEEIYPSLGAEGLRIAQGASTYVVKSSGASGVESFGQHTGVSQVKIGQFVVPTDAQARVWIHYSGTEPDRFIPAWRVFEPDFNPEDVAGRILFIGTTAAGLKDLRTTPLNPAAAGVEVYAEVIEQILTGSYLLRPDFAPGLEIVYVVIIGLVLIVLLPNVGARWCGLLGMGAIAVAIGGSWYAFASLQWLLDPVFPSLTILAVYVVETGLIFLRTESERRWVRSAFGRYISPAVVDRLAEHPERLTLGGEMREMTILFNDIRDFTARSEHLDAHGLTRFVNRYLTPMTDVVLSARGTIDKYIGDCIMAFWNAPLDDSEHALNACRAALGMRRELARLNAAWAAEESGRAFEPVRIGIGVNTGVCCVGNMGSDQRFDYSVLGDDVNLASRLEGQSKTYGVDIVISETTEKEAASLATMELDLLRVKGRTKPVRIFTLLGDESVAASTEFQAQRARHDTMLAAYRARDWAGAAARLEECRRIGNGALRSVYDLYAARLREFADSPPPPDWDGVYEARHK